MIGACDEVDDEASHSVGIMKWFGPVGESRGEVSPFFPLSPTLILVNKLFRRGDSGTGTVENRFLPGDEPVNFPVIDFSALLGGEETEDDWDEEPVEDNEVLTVIPDDPEWWQFILSGVLNKAFKGVVTPPPPLDETVGELQEDLAEFMISEK